MGYKMKGSSFYGKNGETPIKGLFGGLGKTLGKVLNPASMLPGKFGDIAGKLNPLSGILMTGCACGKKKCNCK
jgi:hypothetical protein